MTIRGIPHADEAESMAFWGQDQIIGPRVKHTIPPQYESVEL